jgi:hypothetical protein
MPEDVCASAPERNEIGASGIRFESLSYLTLEDSSEIWPRISHAVGAGSAKASTIAGYGKLFSTQERCWRLRSDLDFEGR